MTKRWWLIVLTVGLFIGGGIEAKEQPIRVAVSNYPLAYFAERLLGAEVRIVFPVPAGEDPAFFTPDAKAIEALQSAELIALNGADYEKWLSRVTLRASRLIDTSAAFKARLIRIEKAVTHSHGPGGEHSHAGLAFTTWLDFDQAIQQVEVLADALRKKRPELTDRIRANEAALNLDLRQLDEAMKNLGARYASRPLLGSHPVYQYLARRYQLRLESVHFEPGQAPDASEWANFEALRIRHPATVMLWEGTPDAGTAAKLKALGVKPLVFDPCANRPETGDFLEVMRANLLRFAAGLEN